MKTTEKKGTKENHTHVIFYYSNGSKLTVNKFTHEHVFPNEEKVAERVEYIIRSER